MGTGEDVPVLLQWADEYQMQGLTKRIERFLLMQKPDTVDGLALAVKYQLSNRREQCLKAVSSNFQQHLTDLPSVLEDADVMGLLWPVVFREAGLRMPRAQDMSLALAWPAIALGIWKQARNTHSWQDDASLKVKCRFILAGRNEGIETKIRVKDPLRRAMSAFERHHERHQNPLPPGKVFVFEFEDAPLSPEQTPADLGWSPWHACPLIVVKIGETRDVD